MTGEKRVEGLPDVPTMEEAGYPGQIGETPIGILAPAGTPKEIVDLLHRKVVEVIAMPDVKQKLASDRASRRSAIRPRNSPPS